MFTEDRAQAGGAVNAVDTQDEGLVVFLDQILRANGIRNLWLLGVTTDVCVSSTMREANDRGYDVLLISDACRAATPALHEATLAGIEREGGVFGAHISSSALVKAVR